MTYIVQTAAERMPGRCWGIYRRCAVLRVDDGIERVSMISERARGVQRIVRQWNRQHTGRSGGTRTAFARALTEAQQLADMLNSIEIGAPVWEVKR